MGFNQFFSLFESDLEAVCPQALAKTDSNNAWYVLALEINNIGFGCTREIILSFYLKLSSNPLTGRPALLVILKNIINAVLLQLTCTWCEVNDGKTLEYNTIEIYCCLRPKKSPVSGLRARLLRPARRHFYFLFFFFGGVTMSKLQPELLDPLEFYRAVF